MSARVWPKRLTASYRNGTNHETRAFTMRSVVLGVGNVLLTDEGAGIHAARRLAESLRQRSDVRVIDGGTLGFTLAPMIAGSDRLIVIDAAQLSAPAGTVRTYFDAEFDRFLGRAKLSAHEVNLVDLMDIARLTDEMPVQRALVAVQPRSLDWGEALTAEVEDAIAGVVLHVTDLLDAWPAPSTATREVSMS